MSSYPAKIEGASCYVDGARLPVMAEVDLPEIEFEEAEIAGMGLSGVLSGVLPGLAKAMEATFKPSGLSSSALRALVRPGQSTEVDVRWVQSKFDDRLRAQRSVPGRAFMVCAPKGFKAGTIKHGRDDAAEVTVAVSYLRIEQDGVTIIEVDPVNQILVVDGTDLLADLRASL